MKERPATIRFDSVSKSFGSRKVLDSLSLEIPRGKAYCILGRSGTGKSVTLKLMIGLLQPDSGQIYIGDREISGMDSQDLAAVRKDMGFLFQNSALFDSISVGENVAFPLRRNGGDSEDEIRQKVERTLGQLGLEKEYDKMPSELSGGMRKRAGLARVLVYEPSILLVDEPSAGLDPITSSEIDELLLNLKDENKVTLVVVTHNIPSARRIGDQLVMLRDGKIAAQGSPEDLEQSDDEFVSHFMTAQGGG
jgi:phospholipid/cholesterol/gamma-HCH transport system ATP-binding protein